MSRALKLLVVAVLVGCMKADAPAVDTAAAPVPEVAAAPNAAGTWSVNVMPEGRDTTLLTYTMVATNDTTGWRMTLPGRDPMDVRILHMSADSIVVHNGPYASVLQPGTQVTTHSNVRIDGDRLTGTTVATYARSGGDSVVNLRLDGRRQ